MVEHQQAGVVAVGLGPGGDRRGDRRGGAVGDAAEMRADLREGGVGAAAAFLHQQHRLVVGELPELREHLLDEPRLDRHELLLVEGHAAADLEARGDHAALVGGAVLDDLHAVRGELLASARGEEEVGALDDQPARRRAVGGEELPPVAFVDRGGAPARGHEGVGLHAIVHRVAKLRAVGLLDARDAAPGAELRAVELRDRQALLEESQKLRVVEAVGILAASAAVGDADDPRVRAVVAMEDLDHVAGDVAVGPAGDLDREGPSPRIDPDRLEHHAEEDVHALARHAVDLVVDAGAGLAAHEGRRHRVAAQPGPLDDPLDVLRRDVLVGAEIYELLAAEPVDHEPLRLGIGRDQVEQRVDEALDAAGDLGAGLDQHRGLGAALGNVLVLELLGEGEPVRLVVEPLALAGVLRLAVGPHDPQAAAGDVLEAHVESGVAAAVHEEDPVRQLLAILGAKQFRIDPHRKAEAPRQEEVRAEHRADRLDEPEQHRVVRIDADGLGDAGPQRVETAGELLLRQRRRGIEPRDEQVDRLERGGEVLLERLLDALAGVREAVLAGEQLVQQLREREQQLRAGDVEALMPRGDLEAAEVHPLDAEQVRLHPPPQVALRIDLAAVGALDHEADEGDRSVRRIGDDVEVRPFNADAMASEQARGPLEHRAGSGVRDRDAQPRQVGIGLLLELDLGAVEAGDPHEHRVVLAHPKRRERRDVLRRAAAEVRRDVVGAPVGILRPRELDRLAQLLSLTRVVRVEGVAVAEDERVEHQLAVERGVDLGGPQRPVERQAADELREHPGVVLGSQEGELVAVLAAERELERAPRGPRRDDRPQVRELRRRVGVLEVHRRHLLEEPRHRAFGGVAEAADEFIDESRRIGGGVGGGGRRGGNRGHAVEVPGESAAGSEWSGGTCHRTGGGTHEWSDRIRTGPRYPDRFASVTEPACTPFASATSRESIEDTRHSLPPRDVGSAWKGG